MLNTFSHVGGVEDQYFFHKAENDTDALPASEATGSQSVCLHAHDYFCASPAGVGGLERPDFLW